MIDINKNPSKKELAWFGLLFLLFFGIVGGLITWRFDGLNVAIVLWSVAGVITAAYYLVPPMRRTLYLGWMYAVYPLGWLMSHLLLGLIYYVMFTAVGMIMRLIRRDPMHRKFDRAATTYWTEHDPGGDPGRYFRQF